MITMAEIGQINWRIAAHGIPCAEWKQSSQSRDQGKGAGMREGA